MGYNAISTLLGHHKSDPMTETIRDTLSEALGRSVKILPTVKNGYRIDENGKVWLKDTD